MNTKIVSIGNLKSSDIEAMFDLMNRYYTGLSKEVFLKDLEEKQKIILLFGPSGKIEGFSTIVQWKMNIDGLSFIALYSGDTVLNKEFWGNGALASAFGRYLTHVKLVNPWTNVYWFLISKGFKTYLLMTNNFTDYFPRFDKKTPEKYFKIMNHFYSEKFGDAYFTNQYLVKFEKNKVSSLKEDVSEITDEYRKNLKIAFFEQMNPHWHKGEELACVAKVTLWVPLRYGIKKTLKTFGLIKAFKN